MHKSRRGRSAGTHPAAGPVLAWSVTLATTMTMTMMMLLMLMLALLLAPMVTLEGVAGARARWRSVTAAGGALAMVCGVVVMLGREGLRATAMRRGMGAAIPQQSSTATAVLTAARC